MNLLLPKPLPFKTNLAMLSFETSQVPHFFEKLCLFIEYAQIIALTVLFNYKNIDLKTTSYKLSALSFLKVFCPGYLVQIQENNINDVIFWFGFVISVLTTKYIFLTHTLLKLKKGLNLSQLMTKLWTVFFLSQGRTFFLFASSFLVKIAQAANKQKLNNPVTNYPIIMVCIILIVIEYVISLIQNVRYSCCLPTKAFLSSKTNTIETITLTQKILLQFTELFLTINSLEADWTIALINILCCFARDAYYFKYYPPYNLKTLYFQGFLKAVVTSLSICYFIKTIINPIIESDFDDDFPIMIWLFISPVFLTFCYTYMNRSIFMIFSLSIANSTPMILVQKLSIIKEIRKNRKQPARNSKMNNWPYFLYEYLTVNVHNLLINRQTQQANNLKEFNINNKEQANRIFVRYLEMISVRSPRDQMTKLYIAYYYGVKLKLFVVALKLLKDLEQNCSSRTAFNICLLKYKIQNYLKIEERKTETSLNLLDFFNNKNVFENLKQLIISQAKLQLSLYKQSNSKNPNLANILDYSHNIALIKAKVSRAADLMLKKLPTYYLEPILVYAHYNLELNFSLTSYINHHKAFSQKKERCFSFREMNKLCQENLYDNNKILIVCSIQKENIGAIHYCSNSVENILGWDAKETIGRNLSFLFPSCLSPYYLQRLKTSIETKGKSMFKDIFRSFAVKKDGDIELMDFYCDLHPFVYNGVFLDIVLRPVKTSTQYMIVDKNGMVQSASLSLARKLCLPSLHDKASSSSETKIASLSQELDRIDKACDIFAYLRYHKKIKTMENLGCDECIDSDNNEGPSLNTLFTEDLESQISLRSLKKGGSSIFINIDQSVALYEKMQSQGQTLILNSLKRDKINPNIAFRYDCKAIVKFFPSAYLKIFSFDEVRDFNCEIKSIPTRDEPLYLTLNEESNREGNECAKQKLLIKCKNEAQGIQSGVDLTKSARTSFSQNGDDAPITYMKQMNSNSRYTGKFITKVKGKSAKISDNLRNNFETTKTNTNILKMNRSLGSQESKLSENTRIGKAFQNALDVKHYSKVHNVCFSVFYLILLFVFIDNLAMQLTSNKNLQTLGTRREVVEAAESINDLLTRIHRNMRFIMNFELEKLDESYFALYNNSRKSLVGRITDDLNSIKDANRKLILSASSLHKDDRDKIMKNNITLYQEYFGESVQQSFDLNTFQSTIKLYEAGIKGISAAKVNASKAFPDFKFFLRNALNNFLLNSEMISDLFLSVSEEETNFYLTIIVANLGLVLLFLTLLLIMASILIVQQCKAEIENLSAFVKLNPVEINLVAAQIHKFKTLLEADTSFEELSISEIPEYYGNFVKGVKSNINNRETTTLNYKGILRKYLFLLFKVFFALLIIGGLLLGGYFQKKTAFEIVYSKLTQIHFSRRMISKVNLAVTNYLELFSENNSTQILNTPTVIQLRSTINTEKLITKAIPDVFQTGTLEVDPIVQSILFDDGCQFVFQDQSAFARCIGARKGKDHVSFMTLLAEIDIALEAVNNRFYQSNRTTQDLCRILTETFTEIVIPNRVVSDLGKTIANTLGQSFLENITKTLEKNDTYDILVGIILICIGLLIWISAFKKIREADNSFKKVLKTLPVSIVMSNFLLKAYLLKTSKNTLNFIRNQI